MDPIGDWTRDERFTRGDLRGDDTMDNQYDHDREWMQNDDDLDFEDDLEPNESHMEEEHNLQY